MKTLGIWSVVLVLTLAVGAADIAAQQRAKPRPSRGLVPYPAHGPRTARAPRILHAPAATIVESEPNDNPASADAAALGDTLSGSVDPVGDLDWYVFSVAQDTVVVLDVDANQLGSPLDPVIWLVASDGSTILDFNDDFDGLDSYIEFHISTPGQYYAVVAAYGGGGGTGEYYYLRLSGFATPPPPTPGPGDPTTLFAAGLDGPWGVAAGASGEFYVTDVNSGRRVLRVSSTGVVSTLASFPTATPIKVTLDGLGNLLVTYGDSGFTRGGVARVTVGGNVSSFATGLSAVSAITVGPDGDVWVLDNGAQKVFRFDPFGLKKDSIDVSSASALSLTADLAFSPSGVLYLSNGYDAIFRIVNRAPQLAISGPPYLESIAFDQDGYLYVANGFLGKVLLYGPDGQMVNDPFALSNLGGPIYLAFGRAADGSMTSRLFASNYGYNLSPPYIGSVVEMRQGSLRAPGFRVGLDLLAISTASLPAGVMGASYSATLQVTAPPATPVWSIANGGLPPGLSLSSAGTISGVPQATGAFNFVVRVDAGGRVGFRSFTLTVTQPALSITDAANDLLDAAQLTAELHAFLDLQGNRNGRYDVGDFRAYLRAQGQLPASAAATRKEHP